MIALRRHERDGQFPSDKGILHRALSAGRLLGVLQKQICQPISGLGLDDALIVATGSSIVRLKIPSSFEQSSVEMRWMRRSAGRADRPDCGRMAVELQAVASPRLETMLGRAQGELMNVLTSVDIESLADTRRVSDSKRYRPSATRSDTAWQAERGGEQSSSSRLDAQGQPVALGLLWTA